MLILLAIRIAGALLGRMIGLAFVEIAVLKLALLLSVAGSCEREYVGMKTATDTTKLAKVIPRITISGGTGNRCNG